MEIDNPNTSDVVRTGAEPKQPETMIEIEEDTPQSKMIQLHQEQLKLSNEKKEP